MEGLLLVEEGHTGKAVTYILMSVTLGFAAAVSAGSLSRNI